MKMRKVISGRRSKEKGQSFIELALVFVMLLLLIVSIFEFAYIFLAYMGLNEAVRNAARYSSDGQYLATDNIMNCDTTRDFFRQTACLVNQELDDQRPIIEIDYANQDDVVVSVWGIKGSGFPGITDPVVSGRYPSEYGEAGYSESLDWTGTRHQSSDITTAFINDQLNTDAPSTGLVAIEIFYHYHQQLRLPWLLLILPDPLPIRVYAIMPLVSAEPRP
jgi:hypothetical protein